MMFCFGVAKPYLGNRMSEQGFVKPEHKNNLTDVFISYSQGKIYMTITVTFQFGVTKTHQQNVTFIFGLSVVMPKHDLND